MSLKISVVPHNTIQRKEVSKLMYCLFTVVSILFSLPSSFS